MPGPYPSLHGSYHTVATENEYGQTDQNPQMGSKLKTKKANVEHQEIHQPDKQRMGNKQPFVIDILYRKQYFLKTVKKRTDFTF